MSCDLLICMHVCNFFVNLSFSTLDPIQGPKQVLDFLQSVEAQCPFLAWNNLTYLQEEDLPKNWQCCQTWCRSLGLKEAFFSKQI